MNNKNSPEILLETLAIHADRKAGDTSSVAPPIYQTSTFKASSAAEFSEIASTPRHEHFYTRYGNPTRGQASTLR